MTTTIDARRRHPTALVLPDGTDAAAARPHRGRGGAGRRGPRGPRVERGRREGRLGSLLRARRRRIGVATDRPHTPPVFWTILASVAALTVIGLVFVLSASSWRANRQLDSSWYWFGRQSFFVAMGAGALALGVAVPYRFWVRHSRLLLLGVIAALVVVLIPTGLSHSVNGSRRWLGPEFVSFQPSELAKLAMILWLARLLSMRADRIRDARVTVYPAFAMLLVVAFLVVREPDLGTTILICVITCIVLAVAGVRLDSLAGVIAPFATVGVLLAFQGYRGRRMMAFLDPWEQATTAGWQTLQSRVGIASGGVFGVGLGNGRSKWGFLPEAHTDFIFSVIGEELGLLGCLAVLGLFLAFIVAGVNAGRRARDRAGTLVAVGISSWIGLQALFNIGVAVGVLPNKGITLPFVSYGGSSLAVTMFATGILLNVARNPATAPRRSTRGR